MARHSTITHKWRQRLLRGWRTTDVSIVLSIFFRIFPIFPPPAYCQKNCHPVPINYIYSEKSDYYTILNALFWVLLNLGQITEISRCKWVMPLSSGDCSFIFFKEKTNKQLITIWKGIICREYYKRPLLPDTPTAIPTDLSYQKSLSFQILVLYDKLPEHSFLMSLKNSTCTKRTCRDILFLRDAQKIWKCGNRRYKRTNELIFWHGVHTSRVWMKAMPTFSCGNFKQLRKNHNPYGFSKSYLLSFDHKKVLRYT